DDQPEAHAAPLHGEPGPDDLLPPDATGLPRKPRDPAELRPQDGARQLHSPGFPDALRPELALHVTAAARAHDAARGGLRRDAWHEADGARRLERGAPQHADGEPD